MESLMRLVIGNKSYSSWSMRPWVLMRQAGIAFEEQLVRFDSFAPDSVFKRELAKMSPVGKVPVLIVDADEIARAGGEPLAIWDTLAIAEYLAERFPDRQLWPAEPAARARARSVCAEMHSGFGALRSACPMNLDGQFNDAQAMAAAGARLFESKPEVRADLQRIVSMWSELLAEHGGPLLFGRFSIADAYFAPVCSRIRTYALPVPAEIDAYIDRVFELPGVAAWVEQALAEHEFLGFEEPYRPAR
jgi:glutathione S-transferase